MSILKNDNVMIIRGAHKGQTGRVIKVFPAGSKVVVEGRNMAKRHQKPTQKNPQGGIAEKEAPIAISNLLLVCPKCNVPTRVGKKILEDKRKVRICKKCKEMIS